MKEITVLNIAQPWAHCILKYGKNVENRSQNLKKRGTIAIYASANLSKERFEACNNDKRIKITPEEVSFGCIVGFVDVVDVIRRKDVSARTKKWFYDHRSNYGYILKNPVFLKKPVKVKPPAGAVKFWFLKGPKLKACLAQISVKQRQEFKNFE
jgi:hypothetical protein